MENYTDRTFRRVRSRLGEPIIHVELNDSQMEDLFESAHRAFDLLLDIGPKNHEDFSFGVREKWVEQYFTALCKEALGRVRGKFSGETLIPGGNLKLGYKDLLEEANREKNQLTYLILKDRNILVENLKPVLVFYVGVGNISSEDVQHIMEKTMSSFDKEDGFIKYFIPIKEQESRIECIYPVSGIEDKTKSAIQKLEDDFKNLENEQ